MSEREQRDTCNEKTSCALVEKNAQKRQMQERFPLSKSQLLHPHKHRHNTDTTQTQHRHNTDTDIHTMYTQYTYLGHT